MKVGLYLACGAFNLSVVLFAETSMVLRVLNLTWVGLMIGFAFDELVNKLKVR